MDKLNPKWRQDFHCLVSIPDNNQQHPFEHSQMKIVVLGSNDIVLGSKEYAGNLLEEFVTHRDDGSGVWEPPYAALVLDECTDPKGELVAWTWMKKLQPADQAKLIEIERIQEIENTKKAVKDQIEKKKQDEKKLIAKQKKAKKDKLEKAKERRKLKALEGSAVIHTKRDNKKDEIARRKREKREAQEKADTSLFQRKRLKKSSKKEEPISFQKKNKSKTVSMMSKDEKSIYHQNQKSNASRLHGRRSQSTSKSARQKHRNRSQSPEQLNRKTTKRKNKRQIKKEIDQSYLDRLSAGKTPTSKKPSSALPPPIPKRKVKKVQIGNAPSNYENLQNERKLRKIQKKEAAKAKKSIQATKNVSKNTNSHKQKKKLNGKGGAISQQNRFQPSSYENARIKQELEAKQIKAKERTSKSMLPLPNLENLKHAFSQYDIDDGLSIDPSELLRWMNFMYRRDQTDAQRDTKSNESNLPKLSVAEYIVGLHDDSGDGVLQYNELEEWIVNGTQNWNQASIIQRAKFKDHSKNNLHSLEFLERLVTWSVSVPKDAWLPPLHRRNLFDMFDKYVAKDKTKKNQITEMTSEILLKWMVDISKTPKDLPTLASANQIVALHDTDQNGNISYKELEKWISGGAHLPKEERIEFSKKSDVM